MSAPAAWAARGQCGERVAPSSERRPLTLGRARGREMAPLGAAESKRDMRSSAAESPTSETEPNERAQKWAPTVGQALGVEPKGRLIGAVSPREVAAQIGGASASSSLLLVGRPELEQRRQRARNIRQRAASFIEAQQRQDTPKPGSWRPNLFARPDEFERARRSSATSDYWSSSASCSQQSTPAKQQQQQHSELQVHAASLKPSVKQRATIYENPSAALQPRCAAGAEPQRRQTNQIGPAASATSMGRAPEVAERRQADQSAAQQRRLSSG